MHPDYLSKAQQAAFAQIDATIARLAERAGQPYTPPEPPNPHAPADLNLLKLSERLAAALAAIEALTVEVAQ